MDRNKGKLDSVGELFSKTVQIYKQNFKLLLIVSGISAVVYLIQDILLQLVIVKVHLGIYFGIVIAALIFLIWHSTLTILIVNNGFDFHSAFKSSFKFFWRNLWVEILGMFIILGGYLLFFIPGVIFAILFWLVYWETILEGKKGLVALGASREKIRGYFWPVFGRFILVYLPSYLIAALTLWFNFHFKTPGVKYLMIGVQTVIRFFYGPLIILYGTLIFKQLKEINEKKKEAVQNSGRKYLFVGLGGYVFVTLILFIGVFIAAAYLLGKEDGRLKATAQQKVDTKISDTRISLEGYKNLKHQYPNSLQQINDMDKGNGMDFSGMVYKVIGKEGSYLLCDNTATKMGCYGPVGKTSL